MVYCEKPPWADGKFKTPEEVAALNEGKTRKMTMHTSHRPKSFDEVIGQDTVVKSFRGALKANRSHTFLFHGPSGCGKTTLAYLAAKQLKADSHDILDIDAATYTGIDDMRSVTRNLEYRPFKGESKVVILDECHMLSNSAWNSLLKATESPPDYVYWFFCTTELRKVPKTIKTRCLSYALKPVSPEELKGLLQDIILKEHLKVNPKVLGLCIREADGSPRQAIVNLEACSSAATVDEAAELLHTAGENPVAFDLAKALNSRANWRQVQKLLVGLRETNPESIRRIVLAYMTTVILGAKQEDVVGKAMEVLDAFGDPFPSGEGIAPLVRACGRLLLS